MTLRAHLRHEAPALAALLLLAVVQLWPAVGPERLPESLDLMLQYVPNASFLQRSLRGGAVPLWNPYLGAGMPFAADPGAGAWYLPSWPLLLALPLFSAVRAGLWLHLLWAALGTYAFCRLSLGVGRLASLVGAVAFALTTWLPGLAGMPAVLTSVAWLPWIVVLGDIATRRGGRWRAALSLAGALQLLAGWPAGAYLSWLTLGLLLVLRRPLPLAASRAAPAGLAAALLAGVLLVPAFELIGESTYAETRSVEAAGREAYLTLLSWLRPASGSGALESSQLYVGIGAIVLALVGALARDRTARAMVLVAVLAFLVAMGTRTPLFGALYAWLPGFRVVYLPARLGIVAAFGLAGLAALGLQRVASGAVTGRQLALVIGGALALVPLTLLQFWLSEGYDSFRRLLTNVGRVTGGPYLSVAQELQYLVFGVCALGALALSRTAARRAAAPALAALLTADALLAHQSARPPRLTRPAGTRPPSTPPSGSAPRWGASGLWAPSGTVPPISSPTSRAAPLRGSCRPTSRCWWGCATRRATTRYCCGAPPSTTRASTRARPAARRPMTTGCGSRISPAPGWMRWRRRPSSPATTAGASDRVASSPQGRWSAARE